MKCTDRLLHNGLSISTVRVHECLNMILCNVIIIIGSHGEQIDKYDVNILNTKVL